MWDGTNEKNAIMFQRWRFQRRVNSLTALYLALKNKVYRYRGHNVELEDTETQTRPPAPVRPVILTPFQGRDFVKSRKSQLPHMEGF